MRLLFDELLIISILDAKSPEKFISKATEILPYYDENDEEDKKMLELLQTTINKVKNMTVEEFAAIDLPYI